METVLVTGGAGYVGSHTCKLLAARGFLPIVYDNLERGNRRLVKWGPLEQGDLADRGRLEEVLAKHRPRAVLHFAAFAYVGESLERPELYFRNNVVGSLTLIEAMLATGVPNIVFSSTCAVYGLPDVMPITEDTPKRPINPYGTSKLMVERIVEDVGRRSGLGWVALRYFNACGADPEGEIGELHDPEPHLIPRALMAASGSLPILDILGTDYPNPDGTAIRDYIHVSDLAEAHIRALDFLLRGGAPQAFNVGTGRGFSVREVVHAVERITGHRVPLRWRGRRPGDPSCLVADVSRAREMLGFTARSSYLDHIIATAWRWHASLTPEARPDLAGRRGRAAS
jgi:UDP-glucose-4-epimerase GalE